MCYILSQHFSGFFLFLCMLCYGLSPSSTTGTIAYARPLNSSEEIKSIFSIPDEPVLKGAHGTGNFAEGGLINVNLTQSPRTLKKNLSQNQLLSSQDGQHNSYTYSTGSKINNSSENSTVKTFISTKLTDNGSNLFLGVPEVIHINGTSSIKPRKGVYYNKIVPRKGVDNDNETDLENQPCFQLTENECYDAKEIHNLKCTCCKEGNMLGKVIKKQALVNCKNCKSINLFFPERGMCKNICCNSIHHDTHSSANQNSYNSQNSQTMTSPQSRIKQQSVFDNHISDRLETSNDLPEKVTDGKNLFMSSKKNSKLKPSVTKVPYDVEIMTELLSKAQQKVFVPVIVSVFLLPLIGVLLFFLWRRTKEYWDKMYYRKMDFLIDGIYND